MVTVLPLSGNLLAYEGRFSPIEMVNLLYDAPFVKRPSSGRLPRPNECVNLQIFY